MPTAPVKSAKRQAEAMVLAARDLLVGQRTQLVNAIRSHVAEFGVITARGITRVEGLPEAVAANDGVPKAAPEMLAFLGQQAVQLDTQIEQLERRMQQM